MSPRCAPVVNGCEFSPSLGAPSVHIDNAKAAYEAMDHLYKLGHRRIGVITGPLVSPLSRDRLQGVKLRTKKTESGTDLYRDAGRLFHRVGRGGGRTLAGSEASPHG